MSGNGIKRSFIIDTFHNPPKRFKDFNESDDELNDNELQIDLDIEAENTETIDSFKEKTNVTWTRPYNSDYLSVTGPTGHRCYITIVENKAVINNVLPSQSCKVPNAEYYRLLDQAEELLRHKKENQIIPSHQTVLHASKTLWVTKYAPRKYIDLLSSESSNRSLLSWLKSWDKYVFNRESKFVEKLLQNSSTGFQGNFTEDALQIDPKDGMPVKKVVLLAGPPGLGKTTLAHIVAEHCGYSPIEINASDDRSPEQFRIRIQALNDAKVGISSFSNKKQPMKPCCLILDEIDGTPVAAVNVLINAINASTSAAKSSENRKEKSQLKINRPIICICNDLYAPSLKLLKPLCHVIKITPPDFNQMVQRLVDICKWENIDCNRSTIINLIDISNRDIRSCLNSLQFLKHQHGNMNVNDSHLSSVNIGQKDVELGAFRVWQDIFTEPDLKKVYIVRDGKNCSDLSLRFNRILSAAQSTGDLDLIINGIYDNYLSVVRFREIYLKAMVEAAEWIVFNDLANKQINSKQIYEVQKYKPYIIPFFHLSFASTTVSPGSIRWPVSEKNAHSNLQKIQAIYDVFVSHQGCVSQWIQSKQEVISSVLPNLVNIIRPIQLRPINTQLYSNKEKMMLQHTVEIMISTGLTYTQERITELQYQYVLNPNIEEISRFQLEGVNRKELSYSTKQMIANEVNLEKIKKSSANRYKSPVEPSAVLNEFSQDRIGFIMQKANEMKTKKLTCSSNPKASFDFRLGPKVPKVSKVEDSNVLAQILSQAVWFKFKEGYTNAIKRPVKFKDL